MLDRSGCELAWLKIILYASIEGCELEFKRRNEAVGENIPGDENVPDDDFLD